MASRLIAQVVVVAGTYAVRAFAEAYRQALANGAAGSAGRAAGRTAARAADAAGARGRAMSADEAASVLGVAPDAAAETVASRFERMLAANDPAKGGSAYLQAKVRVARETLERAALEREAGRPPLADARAPPPTGSARGQRRATGCRRRPTGGGQRRYRERGGGGWGWGGRGVPPPPVWV